MAKISLQTIRPCNCTQGQKESLLGEIIAWFSFFHKNNKKSSLLQSIHCNSLRCQSTPDSEASGIPSVCPLSTHINPSPSSTTWNHCFVPPSASVGRHTEKRKESTNIVLIHIYTPLHPEPHLSTCPHVASTPQSLSHDIFLGPSLTNFEEHSKIGNDDFGGCSIPCSQSVRQISRTPSEDMVVCKSVGL